MEELTWTVIKFPDEEAVSAVPSSWIVGGNQCYWPPYNKKQVHTAIEKNEMPDTKTWQLFSCTGFRNNVFDTFKEANRKSVLATKTSDLESGTEARNFSFSSKKRKIFRKTYSCSSLEEEEASILPAPPQMKKSKVDTEVEVLDMETNETQSEEFPKSSSTITALKTNVCPTQNAGTSTISNASQRNVPLNNNKNEIESDSKEIIKYLQIIMRKQNILQATMLDISNRITTLENSRPDTEYIQIESIFTQVENLPVDTVQDLEMLENYLEKEMSSTVKEISHLGGVTIYDFIVRATQKLITNRLCGMEYSYEGKRQKKAFCDLRLHELLIKSSMILFKSSNRKEVEVNIQKWIRRCLERSKGKIRN